MTEPRRYSDEETQGGLSTSCLGGMVYLISEIWKAWYYCVCVTIPWFGQAECAKWGQISALSNPILWFTSWYVPLGAMGTSSSNQPKISAREHSRGGLWPVVWKPIGYDNQVTRRWAVTSRVFRNVLARVRTGSRVLGILIFAQRWYNGNEKSFVVGKDSLGLWKQKLSDVRDYALTSNVCVVDDERMWSPACTAKSEWRLFVWPMNSSRCDLCA